MKKKPAISLQKASRDALEPLRTAGFIPPTLFPVGKPGWFASVHHEVEGVGFDTSFVTPFELGRKTAQVALFRTATLGIRVRSLQVTPGINQSTTEPFLAEVFRGVQSAASPFKIGLSFASSVHSPTCFFLSFLQFGQAQKNTRVAKPGDLIAVTGDLGDAVAGLNCLRRFGWQAVKDYARVVRAHLCPEPPLEACLSLHQRSDTSYIVGLMDGLASDLHRLCEKSFVGAQIIEKQLPISGSSREAAAYLNASIRRWSLFGGEDYGLLMAVPPGRWEKVRKHLAAKGTKVSAIGKIVPLKEGIQMQNLEGEQVDLANLSWNPLVRRKVG